MIVDKSLELSSEQAVTASAASTNYVDLGVASRPGVAQKYIAITVKEAAAAAGAATVTFKLQSDSDSAFGSAVDESTTAAIGKADLVLGKQIFIPLPVEMEARYFRMYYTVASGPLTAGKFDAHVVEGIQMNQAYPDAL